MTACYKVDNQIKKDKIRKFKIFEEEDSIFYLENVKGLITKDSSILSIIIKINGLPKDNLYWIIGNKYFIAKAYFRIRIPQIYTYDINFDYQSYKAMNSIIQESESISVGYRDSNGKLFPWSWYDNYKKMGLTKLVPEVFCKY